MKTTGTDVTAQSAAHHCPPFDPSAWDKRELVWRDKMFVKEHVHALFHVPLDFGRKMAEAQAKIDAALASPPRPLVLSDETSAFGSELYVEATQLVPKATMASMSGTFLTRVFDGPYREAPKWVEAMKQYVAGTGHSLDKLYFGYVQCPACARASGHNPVVLFAQVHVRPS